MVIREPLGTKGDFNPSVISVSRLNFGVALYSMGYRHPCDLRLVCAWKTDLCTPFYHGSNRGKSWNATVSLGRLVDKVAPSHGRVTPLTGQGWATVWLNWPDQERRLGWARGGRPRPACAVSLLTCHSAPLSTLNVHPTHSVCHLSYARIPLAIPVNDRSFGGGG